MANRFAASRSHKHSWALGMRRLMWAMILGPDPLTVSLCEYSFSPETKEVAQTIPKFRSSKTQRADQAPVRAATSAGRLHPDPGDADEPGGLGVVSNVDIKQRACRGPRYCGYCGSTLKQLIIRSIWQHATVDAPCRVSVLACLNQAARTRCQKCSVG